MEFKLAKGAVMWALPSGGLYWPAQGLLCLSDLHFGKSERMARRGGPLLPPYEGAAIMAKLQADIQRLNPVIVLCLGDSFDDMDAGAALGPEPRAALAALQAGRHWIWMTGNHDAAPVAGLGGVSCREWARGGVVFRHIAAQGLAHDCAEVSGHYHPKARLAGQSWPAFWLGAGRLIMPAYGAYTGGMLPQEAPVAAQLGPSALAMVCRAGQVLAVPLGLGKPQAGRSRAGSGPTR